jgi:ABC-type glycerol-3-phosphate transport system permease component
MSVVMLIPAVVFVVVVQCNLIRGLTSGAVT